MRHGVLLDTGPLVAFLNKRDAQHARVVAQWREIRPPLLTSEPVLTEALYLLSEHGGDPNSAFDLLDRKVVELSFRLEEQLTSVRKLMHKYRSTPMSLADASLVRMSELFSEPSVFTLDSDFRVYRRHGRQVIPLVAIA